MDWIPKNSWVPQSPEISRILKYPIILRYWWDVICSLFVWINVHYQSWIFKNPVYLDIMLRRLGIGKNSIDTQSLMKKLNKMLGRKKNQTTLDHYQFFSVAIVRIAWDLISAKISISLRYPTIFVLFIATWLYGCCSRIMHGTWNFFQCGCDFHRKIIFFHSCSRYQA